MSPSAPQRAILKFWWPLCAMWLLMAVEGPLNTAIIARLPDPEFNLAAYGVAFAAGLIIEAPVIMLLTAGTAHGGNSLGFHRLLRFTWALNGVITCGFLVLLIPPVYRLVFDQVIGLPAEVSAYTYQALACLLPWPAAIGDRRFFQGVLIARQQTRAVALGTVARVVIMVSTLLGLRYGFGWRDSPWGHLPGATIAAISLSTGVIAEALAVRVMARRVVRDLPVLPDPSQVLSYRQLGSFYLPLALTSFLALAAQPLQNIFVTRCAEPVASLAVLPVIGAFVFILRAIGLSYQEVAIALSREADIGWQPLRRFALLLAGSVTLIIVAVSALTPLYQGWFGSVAGLSDELLAFARVPLALHVAIPALTLWIAWQRAILVRYNRTQPITAASILELAVIVGMMQVGIVAQLNGVTAVAVALTIGRLAGCLYLRRPSRLLRQESPDANP